MDAIVIGAGPAGLASAKCLGDAGLSTVVFERAAEVASSWAGHYDSLHLHTARGRSGLPGMPMPRSYPTFPSRDQTVAYLRGYAERFLPDIRLGTEVAKVGEEAGGWRVEHAGGADTARVVVFATGVNGNPKRADWPGLREFPGEMLHSADYRRPDPFAGKRVLVVGFGNSGADIALDLANAGAEVEVSVRGPVNILPLRLLGLPITSLGLLPRLVGYRMADRLTAPVLRAAIGQASDYGLAEPGKGPVAQVVEDGRVPLIDHGALPAIKAGRIQVRPGLERFEGGEAVFADASRSKPDAVILATGYAADLRPLLGARRDLLTADGAPLISGGKTAAPGLFFCSYRVSPNGQLRQSGVEAGAIARLARRHVAARAATGSSRR